LIEILPLEPKHLTAAAGLFVDSYRELRRHFPALPDALAEPEAIMTRLEKRAGAGQAIAALQNGALVGYLAWFEIDSFRAASRKAGYCPEWAHAAQAGSPGVIRALYREAARRWLQAGCNTHAISLLAHETRAIETWFWNGFGLSVVDAIRPLEALGVPVPAGFQFRPADLSDAEDLAKIEAEHWQHYSQPPVLMETHAPDDAAAFRKFLSDPCNSAWLAETPRGLAAYLRFESSSFGAASIVQGTGTVAITGAFTRPAYRGQGATPALLDAAIHSYRARGFERCSVDFESFNPEAASFWPKYFDPVCLSLIRVPEV
jgi:GNAT superfamily N-acetyltransferase